MPWNKHNLNRLCPKECLALNAVGFKVRQGKAWWSGWGRTWPETQRSTVLNAAESLGKLDGLDWRKRGECSGLIGLWWHTVGTDDTSLSSVRVQWAGRGQRACCLISRAGWPGPESMLNMLEAKQTWLSWCSSKDLLSSLQDEGGPGSGQWDLSYLVMFIYQRARTWRLRNDD